MDAIDSKIKRHLNLFLHFRMYKKYLTIFLMIFTKRPHELAWLLMTASFRCENPLLSLKSSSSFLRLIPRLPLTSIPPFIFPLITCCRRQFLRKIRPIQLAWRWITSCRIFLSSQSNTVSFVTSSVQLIVLLQRYKVFSIQSNTTSTQLSIRYFNGMYFQLYIISCSNIFRLVHLEPFCNLYITILINSSLYILTHNTLNNCNMRSCN
jgi:hypothetical protein